MKLYTKAGDKGMTQIIGKNTVSKADIRIEAYGTIDELNSLMGLIVSLMEDQPKRVKEIQLIQNYLFDCGTDTAAETGFEYRTQASFVEFLENRINEYSEIPPAITQFILPGGTYLASLIQVARTVCRRAERRVVAFQNEEANNPQVLKFLNRLSDYLFILGRVVNHEAQQAEPFYDRSGHVFR